VAELPTLRGERVVLRPAVDGDVPGLYELISQPGVAPWWMPVDHEHLRHELFGGDAHPFVIEVGGRTAGLITFYEENDPYYRHAGIDIAIADDFQDRGLGPEAMRVLARHLFDDRGHHRLHIDPAVANERAIVAYRKVGFEPVGVLRRYERGPDGRWRDSLLMDLLSEELR
jgi:aminoglycoside 6'-N-acetyltransferase